MWICVTVKSIRVSRLSQYTPSCDWRVGHCFYRLIVDVFSLSLSLSLFLFLTLLPLFFLPIILPRDLYILLEKATAILFRSPLVEEDFVCYLHYLEYLSHLPLSLRWAVFLQQPFQPWAKKCHHWPVSLPNWFFCILWYTTNLFRVSCNLATSLDWLFPLLFTVFIPLLWLLDTYMHINIKLCWWNPNEQQ